MVPARPPCAARLTYSLAGHGAKGQLLPSPRPPRAQWSGRAGLLRSWERVSETPRAGLARRAPAVQRLAAGGAGSRPIGATANDKAAGGAAPPLPRGLRPMAARHGAPALAPPPCSPPDRLRPGGASCHRGSCGRTWAAAGPVLGEGRAPPSGPAQIGDPRGGPVWAGRSDAAKCQPRCCYSAVKGGVKGWLARAP